MNLKKNDAYYKQIASYFETEIRTGVMLPGERLPATTALARQFQVTPDTIQQSLTLLAEKGLISRTPRKGTFVRALYKGNTIGIVFSQCIFQRRELAFFTDYLSELLLCIASRGWKYKIFMAGTNDSADTSEFELRKATENGELGGIIEFCTERTRLGDYVRRECPLPTADAIDIDVEEMLQNAYGILAEKGYRNIALIMPKRRKDIAAQEKMLAEIGSRVPPALRNRIRFQAVLTEQHFLECGYDAFRKLWKTKETRPDALIIGMDTLFNGVWYAVMEEKIEVPRELAILTHLNRELPPFTHIKPSAMEVKISDFANFSVDNLLGKINGKNETAKRIHAIYKEGETC